MTNRSAAWTAIILLAIIVIALVTRLSAMDPGWEFNPASCADNPETCQDYK